MVDLVLANAVEQGLAEPSSNQGGSVFPWLLEAQYMRYSLNVWKYGHRVDAIRNEPKNIE